jgi:hypothetical protein
MSFMQLWDKRVTGNNTVDNRIIAIGTEVLEKVKSRYLWHHSAKKWKTIDAVIEEVQRCCFFIGYPRSGHSLVGSLLDAHPQMCISNELDAFVLFEKGFSKQQVFYLIVANSASYAQKGRSQTGYKYDVKGQYQGRFTTLRVIGDKKGGMTTQRIGKNPEVLNTVRQRICSDIKFIHVVRNPFDNIATMMVRTNSTLLTETYHYFQLCLYNDITQKYIGGDNVLTVRHEDLVENPADSLKRMIGFLGLAYTDEYIQSCASIVYKKANRSREKVHWGRDHIDLVEKNIERFGFLDGYTHDTP